MAAPPTIRAQGIAELVSDIVLVCHNIPPSVLSPSTVNSLTVGVSVSTSANLTNNIDFGHGADIVDAVLIINENNCDSPAPSGGSFGSCTTLDSRFQDPQYGRLVSNKTVEWGQVEIPVPGASETDLPDADCDDGGCFPAVTTIRVTSLRVNAWLGGGSVSAFVNVSEPTIPIPVGNNFLVVASAADGALVSEPQVSRGEDCRDGAFVSELQIAESSVDSFRTLGAPAFRQEDRAGEAGYFAPGSHSGGGVSQPTRLLLRFFNVPQGVIVTVPNLLESGSGAVGVAGDQLELGLVTGSDNQGGGGSVNTNAGSTTVNLSGGYGAAVYEVLDSRLDVIDSIVIPIQSTWAANPPVQSYGDGVGHVVVSLAPVTTVMLSNSIAPVPRFIDTGTIYPFVAVTPCGTTLLFPHVTSQSGHETRLAIANRSKYDIDIPTGSGTCVIGYHGSTIEGGPAPGAQTSRYIGSDKQLSFDLSVGDSEFYIEGVEEFTGYVTARCDFEGAVGRASITDASGQQIIAEDAEVVTRDFEGKRVLSPHGLVFDYVSHRDGFDTEIAIINTSEDEFGTVPDSGTCMIQVPGRNPFASPIILAGDTFSTDLSSIAPGYEGWISADCEFQGERGVATISSNVRRFGYFADQRPLAETSPTTSLLIPHVDTTSMQSRLILSNTSDDLLGIGTAQAGSCTINYVASPLNVGDPLAPAPLAQSVFLAVGEQASFSLSDGMASKGIAPAENFLGSLVIDCDFAGPRAVVVSNAGTGADTTVSFVQRAEVLVLPRSDGSTTRAFPLLDSYPDSEPVVQIVNTSGPVFHSEARGGFCMFRYLDPGLGFVQLDLFQARRFEIEPGPRAQGFGLLGCGFPYVRGLRYDRRILAPAKLGVFTNGTWFLDRNADFIFDPATEISGWGSPGDTPVRGDWNGDGFVDLGVFSGGTWFIDSNGDGIFDPGADIRGWGVAGWTPMPGDWNGDGVTDLGAVDPATSTWFIDRNGDSVFDPATEIVGWGSPGDTPVVGDWNGDGRDDIGVFSGGTWFLDRNGDFAFDPANEIVGWGVAGWTPMPGDWNGDGQTDLGAIDPATSAWFRDVNGDYAFDPATEIVGWGSPGDTPAVADWNGDGRDNLGVFSGGLWFVDLNGDGAFDPAAEVHGWGVANWTAVPARRR